MENYCTSSHHPKKMLPLLTLLFSISVNALQCQYQWQCSPVSQDYNYVDCIDGQCECITDRGFGGNATVQNKCACSLSVKWLDNQIYCLSFANSVAYRLKMERKIKYEGIVKAIYQAKLWPTASTYVPKLKNNVLTGGVFDFFSPTVRSRIDPIGNFTGLKQVVEYLLVPFAGDLSHVTSLEHTEWITENDLVYTKVEQEIKVYAFKNGPLVYNYTLTESGIWRFDENDKIYSMGLQLHALSWATEPLYDNKVVVILKTCETIVNKCSGSITGYTSPGDCVNFLTNLEFGTMDYLRKDSAVCRHFHSQLVDVDPDHACPEVGKTTPKYYCYNRTPQDYEDYFDENY